MNLYIRPAIGAIAWLSIFQILRQRIFSGSNQVNNDAAEEEKYAVFPAAIGFAGVIPTVFKMYGTGNKNDYLIIALIVAII